MSRELIAADKNPHGGIKKKKNHTTPTPPGLFKPPNSNYLNKPGAAQLTIRKPCWLARGIHANSPHHHRLHVLPISAAATDAGKQGCLPAACSAVIQTSWASPLWKVAVQTNPTGGVPYMGPLPPHGTSMARFFWDMGLLQYMTAISQPELPVESLCQ